MATVAEAVAESPSTLNCAFTSMFMLSAKTMTEIVHPVIISFSNQLSSIKINGCQSDVDSEAEVGIVVNE